MFFESEFHIGIIGIRPIIGSNIRSDRRNGMVVIGVKIHPKIDPFVSPIAHIQTNIGSGLTTGAELFNKVPDSGSRAMILLSDGAGRIDAATQEKIKDWFGRFKISLYWIVLRQPGGISIFNTSFKARDDEALPPQIELNEFFKTLNSPFQAYEAEDPKTLQKAIEDINQKEKKPIKYFEKIPGQDYSTHCFVAAILMMIVLLSLKLIEVRSWL